MNPLGLFTITPPLNPIGLGSPNLYPTLGGPTISPSLSITPKQTINTTQNQTQNQYTMNPNFSMIPMSNYQPNYQTNNQDLSNQKMVM